MRMNEQSHISAQPVLFGQLPSGPSRPKWLTMLALATQALVIVAFVRFAPPQLKNFVSQRSPVWVELPQQTSAVLEQGAIQLSPKKPADLVTLKLQKPLITPPVLAEAQPAEPPVFNREVQRPVLAIEATSAAAPLKPEQAIVIPTRKVQTGGFGDENGPPPMPKANGPAISAAIGYFDAQAGSGVGNGNTGSIGRAGFVESAGFGGGVADRPSAAGTSRAPSATSGFDAASAAPAPRLMREPSEEVFPVRVTSKPAPVYTDEARALRIEGDVVLEVLFEASGNVRVLRVVRGLGHGLDESAQRAAEKIQFSPARKSGMPTDYKALLHVAFRLA